MGLKNFFKISMCYFAIISGVAFAISMATSCKGRTMENMEPTGDTVEVVIEQPSLPIEETEVTETINNNEKKENEDY